MENTTPATPASIPGLTATGLKPTDYPWPYSIVGEYVNEQYLTEEIDGMWRNRQAYSESMQFTKAEMRSLDVRLSEMLYTMKQVFCRPGRGGGWSAWLKERRIPRATADRMVQRYVDTLPEHEESPHEQISERPQPTDAQIAKLLQAVLPRLRKVLTTSESVVRFITCIAISLDVNCEWRDEGVMIFDSVDAAAQATTSAADLSSPVNTASDNIIDALYTETVPKVANVVPAGANDEAHDATLDPTDQASPKNTEAVSVVHEVIL